MSNTNTTLSWDELSQLSFADLEQFLRRIYRERALPLEEDSMEDYLYKAGCRHALAETLLLAFHLPEDAWTDQEETPELIEISQAVRYIDQKLEQYEKYLECFPQEDNSLLERAYVEGYRDALQEMRHWIACS